MDTMKHWMLIILTGVFSFQTLNAQEINLVNPSFEGEPSPAATPSGWVDCGMSGETPPDTHPAPLLQRDYFGVVTPAQHGQTYMGLVVRDNDTWERVAQKLNQPLAGGQCYKFNMQLASSPSYLSMSKTVGRTVEFNEPIVLRLWAAHDYCEQGELLDETEGIDHADWREYNFEFTPTKAYRYFMIEAFYKTPVLFPYRGNILVDNCSPIVACNLDMPTTEPIASAELDKPKVNVPPKKDPPKKNPPKKDPPKKDPVVSQKPAPPVKKDPVVNYKPPVAPSNNNQAKPKIIPDLNSTIIEGQKIRVEQLYFAADSSKINSDSYAALDEIYSFLRQNSNISVEIGGHTNGLPDHDWCDAMSKKRAEAVAGYLKSRGIDQSRIMAKGYGKREPIASNSSQEGRKKNQRVEIKILSLGGN